MSDEKESLRFIIPTELPEHEIAFVIDGVVQERIWVPDRFAALLLSEPVITYTNGVNVVVGESTYDPETKTFTHPDGTTEQAKEFEI
jgi:hypothetical protein